MKKLLTTLLLISLSLCLVACEQKQENANIANPVVSVSSIDEVNDKLGTHLVTVGVMGKENETFSVINDELGEYNFEVNGYPYTLRVSKDTTNDISGIYVDGKTLFEGMEEFDRVYNESPEYKAFRFVLGNEQYVLMMKDNGETDGDVFYSAYNEILNHIVNDNTDQAVKDLVGSYQDKTSERATAEVSLYGVNEVEILIDWADTADSYHSWYMTGLVQGNKISYKKGVHEAGRAVENGVEAEILSEDLEGYFEIIDGNIAWTGSGDDMTVDCVFEKIN